jgi:hypothetical protein
MSLASARLLGPKYDRLRLIDRPVSPNVMDDEFDDGVIDAKWTDQYTGTAPTWVEQDGRLYGTWAIESGGAFKAKLQSVPSGDWTIATNFAFTATGVNFQKPAGLILAEGTTSQGIIYFGPQLGSGTPVISHWRGSSWSSFAAETVRGLPMWGGYLRIRKSGTAYHFEHSADGVTWIIHKTDDPLPFTAATIGIGGTTESSVASCGAEFEWFRRTA